MDHVPPAAPAAELSPQDRLDSWKEIAAYLRRDVTTVQRWERREAMPVHRHVHDKAGSVYAFRSELDAWSASRKVSPADQPQQQRPAVPGETPDREDAVPDAILDGVETSPVATADRALTARAPTLWSIWWLAAAGAALAIGLTVWQLAGGGTSAASPLTGARFQPLTDFGGAEQAAALSRDGRFVTFLSDRDGRMDVWVSQIGTGLFYNLTKGAAPEVVNPSVRTLGFSPDGTAVTFWSRKAAGNSPAGIGIWAAPVLGGPARPYLEDAAEFDWSSDGSRLVYHTPGPGDPMFVRDRDGEARQIFSAPAGLHAHFPVWSPDQSFIYFVQGAIPEPMDIWRISASGGAPERITHHDARVSHPVFLDGRTLLYLASDAEGAGLSIYSVDVRERRARRVSGGIERYSSLAASSDGRRLVATMARPKGAFWRLPVQDGGADAAAARRIPLTTGNGVAPRLGPGFLLYVTQDAEGDSIWKLQGDAAVRLWSAAETRITGGPAISRDGRRIAFVAQRQRQAALYVADADGTNARILASSLQLHGAPAWTPDGQSLTVGVVVDGAPRLHRVPLDGSPPAPLVPDHSMDPVWSPDGGLLTYSGPDIGATFPVKIVTPGAVTNPRRTLTLSRGSRHLCFMPGGRSLLVLRGEIGHKNVWMIDLETGAERQLTTFDPGFTIRDFDISPDGRELVVEQVQEHSDIVLIQLAR